MNWPKEDLRLSINTPVRCYSFMLLQCYFNGFCKVYLMLIQNMLLYLKFFFFFFWVQVAVCDFNGFQVRKILLKKTSSCKMNEIA